MSWSELSPPPAVVHHRDDPQKVTYGQNSHGVGRLIFNKHAMAALKLSAGDRFRVCAGGGDHLGKLRLERRADGAFPLEPYGSGKTYEGVALLRLGRVQGAVPGQIKAEQVEVTKATETTEDLCLVVQLPTKAINMMATIEAAAKPTGASAALKARAAALAKSDQPRDVTAQVMGDPPPGRAAR